MLLCCLGGILLGQVYANRISESVIFEIKSYLKNYICLDGIRDYSTEAFFSTFWGYFRYPLISYLLGFSSIGILLLPFVSLVFGFLLSFFVSCFTAAYGTHGILLSLAVIGVRCIVTLPCFLLISVHSFGRSLRLVRLAFGSGRHTASAESGAVHFKTLCIFSVILILGVCADVFVSPQILRLVLESVPM